MFISSIYSLAGNISSDCTYLVEQALRMTGFEVGDLSPMEFAPYGDLFTDAGSVQPGDIMMREGHVSVYLGAGVAAQGGIDGYNTGIYSFGSNPFDYSAFVRVK